MQTQQRAAALPLPSTLPLRSALLQRQCACGNHTIAGTECAECQQKKSNLHPASLNLSARESGFSQPGLPIIQRKLAIGAVGDPLERQADHIADQVLAAPLRHASNVGSLGIQRFPEQPTTPLAVAPVSVERTLDSSGRPLEAQVRQEMEQRFGHDFSQVRVHTGATAEQSAQDINAQAYTSGRHIVFGTDHFAPQTHQGRRLLAHELTHVIQQGPIGATVRRVPDEGGSGSAQPVDPICTGFNFATLETTIEGQIKDYKVSKDRLPLIRGLKMLRRCATVTEIQQVRTKLETEIGASEAQAIWAESGTAFGGYTGFYPGYAPDIKGQLTKLGASETLAAGTFELSESGSTHRSRAKAKGRAEVADLTRTDIVYFRGHQYAQYRAPGLFADGDETFGFDLRYVEKAGGFGNVKLMISTSCATLCKEALDVFTSLFPNAAILGYRKSAPINGAAVRDDFRNRLNALTRPLLLDQPVDINTVISTWKAVIEAKHKGHTGPLPGYYHGGDVHYWDGAAWQSIATTDLGNKCKSKGDFSGQYPAPP